MDVAEGRYVNVPHHARALPWEIDASGLVITFPREIRVVDVPEAQPSRGYAPVRVRYLSHACVTIEHRGVRVLVDPWLTGPCFLGGWWLAHAPPSDARALLAEADAVYISHNHPDHLHPETLAWLPRDALLLAPNFRSGSVVRALRAMGFTRVHALDEDELYDLGDGLHVGSLFAGDGRDDSGLFVLADGARLLLTVDANRLGEMALPQHVDLALTSFAGGASGYPLCFDSVPASQREVVVARTRASARAAAAAYVEACDARAWMPYAGFFVEAAPRDGAIRAQNVKNQVEEVAAAVRAARPETTVFDPRATPDIVLVREGEHWQPHACGPAPAAAEHPVALWTSNERARVGALDPDALTGLLAHSGFCDDLIVLIVMTDDGFVPLAEPGWRFDARDGSVSRAAAATLVDELFAARAREETSPRRLLLRARSDALAAVVHDDRPWEELTIGFQCRVDRCPDVYNVAFWHHFTNIRPGSGARGGLHG